jgi:demethoxyubiquinone hydroxylase (CLK1/Coq7/Cat5 family)
MLLTLLLLLLLLCRYRVRPSALLSVLQGAGLAAGAAAALAPAAARNAVLGALQESLTGLYNDQLRAMREAGLSDEVSVKLHTQRAIYT